MANSVTIKGESGGAIGVGTTSPTSGTVTVDKASSGTAVDLKLSGTTVGNVGVISDRVYLTAEGSHGVYLDASANNFCPSSTTGTDNDGNINLGDSFARWKSVYVGTDIRIGGTGTANALDDYEEGTFSIAENNGSGIGVTLTEAQYTKIGRTVHIYVDLAFTGTNSNAVSFSSLPFTADNDKDQQLNVQTNVSASVPQVFVKGANLNTVKNNATANLLYSDVQNKFLRISGTYQID